ncbi:hypothetical protein ILUMI_20583 [Ignelater luminosus]|uniref:DDE-1 domain-containing protein n=1 Tax=Ignelater luminosus TaxID=2038154 RepID=A0A8K0G4G1_IGNLU|nr:hypothetical protein ILUMI_20583 [Ignelater luminosus]
MPVSFKKRAYDEKHQLTCNRSFNKTNVGNFFKNERYKFGPEAIYNIDKTGLTTVQRTVRVIVFKGSKQVGQARSAKRGCLVTLCCGVNAIGNCILPYFIFPRVNFRPYMLNEAPIGSDGSAHVSGWMTAPNVLKCMHAKPNPSSPVLVLLDNYESHISVDILNYYKEVGIVLLTFPPHCSKKLQPLDLSVYGPLKTYYNTAATDWLVSNPGKTSTIYEIPKLAAVALPQAFKLQNIASAGIGPFNSNLFSDDDYLCSAVTDPSVPNTKIHLLDKTPQPPQRPRLIQIMELSNKTHQLQLIQRLALEKTPKEVEQKGKLGY